MITQGLISDMSNVLVEISPY